MRRNCASQECRWQSTRPGTMMVSAASITCASAALISGAIAEIFVPSIRRSPFTRSPTLASMLTMVPPLSRVRLFGSMDCWPSKRRTSSASAVPENPPPAAVPAASAAPALSALRRDMRVSLVMAILLWFLLEQRSLFRGRPQILIETGADIGHEKLLDLHGPARELLFVEVAHQRVT